jgi:hypothetical protein
MTPIELLQSIYLGDRVIVGIFIGTYERVAKIQIDCISRIRSADGLWNFYTAEDIEDGLLVFSQVYSLRIEPAGSLPCDYVVDFGVCEVTTPQFAGYEFHFDSADPNGPNKGFAKVIILAKEFHIENPKVPGAKITA